VIYWPHQDRLHEGCLDAYGKKIKKVIVPAACGGGKTAMMMRVIEGAVEKGFRVAVYSCRIQNTGQLIEQIEKRGIWYGVIAAAFKGRKDIKAPVQICQMQTVFARKKVFAEADIVLVDEAHQQMSDSALWVLNEHEKKGCLFFIGYTATPVGWKQWYEHLIEPPTYKELLECKAHLPCKVFAPETPEAVLGGRLKIQSNGEIS
jgi:superfamily II DNA or RNA helicase